MDLAVGGGGPETLLQRVALLAQISGTLLPGASPLIPLLSLVHFRPVPGSVTLEFFCLFVSLFVFTHSDLATSPFDVSIAGIQMSAALSEHAQPFPRSFCSYLSAGFPLYCCGRQS